MKQFAICLMVGLGLASICLMVWIGLVFTTPAQDPPTHDPPTHDQVLAKVRAATASRDAGTPGWGLELRQSAMFLNRLGFSHEAIDALTLVIQTPENPREHASALRQRGQYRLDLGEKVGGLDDLDRAAAIMEGKSGMGSGRGVSYASVQLQRANTLAAMGRVDEAIEVNSVLLDPQLQASIPETTAAGAFLRQSRLLRKKGDDQAALDAFDELYRRFPAYGSEDGRAIAILRSRAKLRESLHGDPENPSQHYIDELRAIWESEELQQHPEVVPVGVDLIGAARRLGDVQERHAWAVEVLDMIENRQAEWLDNAWAEAPGGARDRRVAALRDTLDDHRLVVYSSLRAAHKSGRKDLSIRAFEGLIEIAKTDEQRQELEATLADLRAQ
jgi:tetratricopeptide (TPR) repeat protein